MEEKKCTKCHRTLHISNFSANRLSKDGYSNICKECLHLIKTEAWKKDDAEPMSDDGPLSIFTPRQLMEELRRRGYSGTLAFTQKIDLSKI